MGFKSRPPEAYKKVYAPAPCMGIKKIKKIRSPYKSSPEKGGRGKGEEKVEKATDTEVEILEKMFGKVKIK